MTAKLSHLIFDFDGTLVNSFDRVMAKAISLASSFGLDAKTLDPIDDLRALSSAEIIRLLKVPMLQIPRLIYELRKALKKELPEMKPFAGIPEVLAKLQAQGFTLGILTSNDTF